MRDPSLIYPGAYWSNKDVLKKHVSKGSSTTSSLESHLCVYVGLFHVFSLSSLNSLVKLLNMLNVFAFT